MPGKRNFNNKTFPNLLDKKIQFNEIPLKTVRVTIYALRWIFLLIFLFISIGIFVLFITGGQNYIQIILGYSITGFFTFFMGYFGWILAQGIVKKRNINFKLINILYFVKYLIISYFK